MKYMIMTFGDRSGLEGKSPEWVRGMIEFMRRIDVELNESGELVFQQGLANAPEAKTVRVADGTPTAAKGPVAAPAQSLAGFWIVDVADEARAIEIAGRISETAEAPIEVRACMDAPPDDVLEEFKRLSAQCMEIVRTKDTGTLQYDTYFNDDQSECVVLERFRDSEALIEHAENLGDLVEAILATVSVVHGELLGEPSAELRAKLAGSEVPHLFTPYQSM